jgi:hypothetical protein
MIAKRSTLANALRVAAGQYDADALTHATVRRALIPALGRRRMVEQFERQARTARTLAEEIEQAEVIELED